MTPKNTATASYGPKRPQLRFSSEQCFLVAVFTNDRVLTEIIRKFSFADARAHARLCSRSHNDQFPVYLYWVDHEIALAALTDMAKAKGVRIWLSIEEKLPL